MLNTGHLHPKVQAAVARQLERFSHTCLMITPYESAVELAEQLNRLAPGPTPKKAIFVTTGAEAVENTIKIARAHTGRSGVIAFGGGFHGRTFMAMALTGKVAPYKAGFGPFPGDVFHAPFPIAYHGVSVQDSLDAIEHLFKYDIEPSKVAAIIVEPVMGEGGFYIAPPEFLQALRKLCDQHGIVLVIDEIQTGFARTGKMFAIEHAGVEPDLMTMAKSLAGGFPLAAVVGKANIMDAPGPGGLGGTYAGSPIACAAALAVLEVIADEQLCERPCRSDGRSWTTLRGGQDAAGHRRGARPRCDGRDRARQERRCAPTRRRPRQGARQARRGEGPRAVVLRALRQRDPLPGAAHGVGRDHPEGLEIVVEALRELTGGSALATAVNVESRSSGGRRLTSLPQRNRVTVSGRDLTDTIAPLLQVDSEVDSCVPCGGRRLAFLTDE